MKYSSNFFFFFFLNVYFKDRIRDSETPKFAFVLGLSMNRDTNVFFVVVNNRKIDYKVGECEEKKKKSRGVGAIFNSFATLNTK